MKNKPVFFVFLIILILVFYSCVGDDERKENVKSVFVVKQKLKDGNQVRIFDGIAAANEEVKLSFKVGGNINSLKLEVGDEVQKNQLIATLDDKPYALKKAQVEYSLKEAKASEKFTKNSYDRIKKLYVNQNASASDIDNAKSSCDAVEAKLKSIQKKLDYTQLQLSYTKLYSPINGYVSAKYVNENENVSVGSPIVVLSDKLVNKVHVNMPESLVNTLKIGDRVKVVFNSISLKKFDAKIYEISKTASLDKKTYLVTVKISGNCSAKSGMSADVYFDFKNSNSNISIVPSNSVLYDSGEHFVYIAKKIGEKYFIKRKNIKVGKLITQGYEVISGLEADDLILKAGMSKVYIDMPVKIGNLEDISEDINESQKVFMSKEEDISKDINESQAVIQEPVLPKLSEALYSEFMDDINSNKIYFDKDNLTFVFKETDCAFDNNSVEVKPRLKKNLDSFFPRLSKVLSKFPHKVKEIGLVGNSSSNYKTAINNDDKYKKNLELSKQRAQNVFDYLLRYYERDNDENNTRFISKVKIFANSDSKIIFDENGKEIKGLSRRVDIKVVEN